MRTWFDIASITNKKGLDGGLVLRCSAGLSFLLEPGLECSFAPPVIDAPRSGCITEVRDEGRDDIVVWFDAVPDIATAEMLIGSHVLINGALIDEAADLAPDEEAAQAIRAAAFAGWRLVDVNEGDIGTIISAEARHEQVLLEVERDGGTIVFVPLADDLLIDADADSATLTMDCPTGLFDL